MSMPALITVVVGVTLAVAPSVPQSPTQQDEPRLRGRSEEDARLDRLVGEGASRHGTGDAGDSESMDESGGAAPYEGPYRSPYRLTQDRKSVV